MSFSGLAGTEVAHLVRGRLRLRVERGPLCAQRLQQAKTACETLPGIDEVSLRPESCSVVAVYDPDGHDDVLSAIGDLPAALHAPLPRTARRGASGSKKRPAATTPEDQKAAAARHNKPPSNKISEVSDQIEAEAEFLAEHSHAARAVVDFARDVDSRLKIATNNTVDLKILFPVGLAAVTILEIGAAAATPMWVTLLLFSMNHFVELRAHEDDDDEDEDTAVDHADPQTA
jgi:hypothetical protein